MSTPLPGADFSFRELVFSDFARHRGAVKPSWLRVVALCLTTPGMIASLVVRTQQCLFRSGHPRLAQMLRPVGVMLIGADFGPGMMIGRGLMLAHPNGLVIGFGLTIGDNVTMAGGVTAAARHYDRTGPQDFATICDGAVLGAHAVLVGNVRIGTDAVVGANSVVLSDVPDGFVAFGLPARTIFNRDQAPS
jgi:serine O-acetyltransferase